MEGRVLIADDEKLVRETLRLTLEEEGFAVWAVSSAIDAFPILEEEDIEVIVSDLRMPVMDGIQFQKQVRERWPDIEFIFMTAFGSVATAVAAARGGGADYLTKPLDTEALLLRVKELATAVKNRRTMPQRLSDDP